MKKRQSYLLLELLIALALVTFSAGILISQPTLFLRKEKVALEKMEFFRRAEVVAANAKAELYKNPRCEAFPLKESNIKCDIKHRKENESGRLISIWVSSEKPKIKQCYSIFVKKEKV